MSRPLHSRLRGLIGQHYRYLSDEWVLIDILSEEDRLVLQKADPHALPSLQNDQYGQARRMTSETLTLPISSPDDPDSYSEELMLLFQGRLPQTEA